MHIVLKSIITVISGGVLWEGVKFIYPELKRPIIVHNQAKETFYENLDPILKAASELYGKLESLSREDFSTYVNPDNSNSIDPQHNKKYINYLFSQFWAQLEYLRLESQYTALSKLGKGNELLRFIETIESRKYRILDRSIQRIIGECLISQKDQKFRVMTLNEFVNQVNDPTSNLSKWVKYLDNALMSTTNKENRQRILRFGVVVAALIDHFDPNYKTVRRRDIYVSKLTEKSKKHIRAYLINHYLPFLKNKAKYYLKK